MHFVIRGESILLGFLKEFFSQERLYGQFPNLFVYDPASKNSLHILLSEDKDEINSSPALIIQEGGFNENIQSTGSDQNWTLLASDQTGYNKSLIHSYTIHCIGRNKGEAKLLQSTTAQAIMGFRKVIYQLGIDSIAPLQGMPPQRMTAQDKQAPSQLYNCPIALQVTMQQQFVVSRVPDDQNPLSLGGNPDGTSTGEYGDYGTVYAEAEEQIEATVRAFVGSIEPELEPVGIIRTDFALNLDYSGNEPG